MVVMGIRARQCVERKRALREQKSRSVDLGQCFGFDIGNCAARAHVHCCRPARLTAVLRRRHAVQAGLFRRGVPSGREIGGCAANRRRQPDAFAVVLVRDGERLDQEVYLQYRYVRQLGAP